MSQKVHYKVFLSQKYTKQTHNFAMNFLTKLIFIMKKIMLFSIALCCYTLAFAKTNFVPNTLSKSSYSKVLPKDFDFQVLSLTSGTLILKIKFPISEETYIYFENKNGIPVTSRKIRMTDQEDIMTIDVSDLPNNSYRLTMASATKRVSKTILIPK